jgi:SAM-dependent methyltransferase
LIFNHKTEKEEEMSVQCAFERSVPVRNELDTEQHLNAIGDFVVGVAGVKKGDSVAVVDDSNGILFPLLKKLGARVLMVENSHFYDAGSLSIASGHLDVMVANMVIHHVRVPTQAIAEMKRVLKSGGRLVMTDWEKYDDVRLKEARNDRWMGFYTSDIRHWLNTAGFSNIIVNPMLYHVLGLGMNSLGDDPGTGAFMATGTA